MAADIRVGRPELAAPSSSGSPSVWPAACRSLARAISPPAGSSPGWLPILTIALPPPLSSGRTTTRTVLLRQSGGLGREARRHIRQIPTPTRIQQADGTGAQSRPAAVTAMRRSFRRPAAEGCRRAASPHRPSMPGLQIVSFLPAGAPSRATDLCSPRYSAGTCTALSALSFRS